MCTIRPGADGLPTLASPDLVLQFGSRSGSAFALVLFGSLFALLGAGVAREWYRRRGRSPWATLLGVGLFFGPFALVYRTSLDGFYEARLSGSGATLGYLVPSVASNVAWSEVASVEAQPAFKGRWRLRVRLTSGAELVSATSQQDAVDVACHELRTRLAARGHGS